MSSHYYILIVIVSLCIMSFVTRSLPFFFGGLFKNNRHFRTVGQFLPGYVMLLLVLYEINPAQFLKWPYEIPAIAGLAVLTLIHLWQRQVLLSIACGTVVYLFVLYLLPPQTIV